MYDHADLGYEVPTPARKTPPHNVIGMALLSPVYLTIIVFTVINAVIQLVADVAAFLFAGAVTLALWGLVIRIVLGLL